ncbi:TBC1 domain family member 16, partial [Plakobranchus ocellatus]
SSRPTLVLTWIPNTTLKKNPHSIEGSPNISRSNTPKVSPRRIPRQEFAKSDESVTLTPSPSPSTQDSAYCCGPRLKKLSQDTTSICSEASVESHDGCASAGSSFVGEDQSKESCGKLSSSNKSQTDSGVGSEEVPSVNQIQNNEKVQLNVKPTRVGIHVNNLNGVDKGPRVDHKNLENCKDTGISSDDITYEEQLVAMLNRNKLHAKVKDKDSGKPISIEIDGDKLVVVTEQMALSSDQNISNGSREGNSSSKQSNNITEHNINHNESKFETSSSQSTDIDTPSLSSDSNNQSPCDAWTTLEGSAPSQPRLTEDGVNCSDGLPGAKMLDTLRSRVGLELRISQATAPPPNTPAMTPDVSTVNPKSCASSSSSTTTSGPDSRPASPYTPDNVSAPSSPRIDCNGEQSQPESPGSCSSSTYSHNLTFPENAMTLSSLSTTSAQPSREKRSARDQLCGVFSVDLGQMRSLRLFYNDTACTQGQIVIASRESQYKILHFHNGGLDKLAEIFDDWSLFAQETNEVGEGDKPYKQFLVVKPHLSDDQCHPEEHLYPVVCEDFWKLHMTDDGRIEDVFQLRKAIFFGGVDPAIRHEVWPFLLHYFPFDSTFEDRERIRNDKYIEYQDIRKVRESQTAEAQELFWRNIQCIVEKDVIRTDRSHPYFRGENNPNIVVLKNILLNYAVANPHMGYTQGMSDLLAPVLAATQQEVDAYWCFAGLMTRTIFVSSPKDCDMDRQLSYLRELLRVTLPKFHYHLKLLGEDALELLFCHRWILLCFKREFCEVEALQIWEACWARYQTDYFHLFLCVAIVAIYGDDVVEQRLPADEILLHFSSLAMHMNGRLVLRKVEENFLMNKFFKMTTLVKY